MAVNAAKAKLPDVTIIGAGIIGICSALALQERGLTVALIDRDKPGNATSYGNAGIISPWSCVPQSMPGIWKSVPKWLLDPEGPLRFRITELYQLLPWVYQFFRNTRLERVHEISDAMAMLMDGNIDAYRRHLAGTGAEYLIQDSWFISVYRNGVKPDLEDLGWKLRLDRGAPIEIVSGKELQDIEPELSPNFEEAVIQRGQSRALDPGKICVILAQKAANQGAEIIQREIKEIVPLEGGGYQLVTDDEPIQANQIALCGGAWSMQLLKPLGIKLPLISERGYHLEFVEPNVELNHSIFDVAGKFIISSMDGRVRAAGTSEFAHADAPPNFKRADILARMSKRIVPQLNIDNTKRWVGPRPSFPDNLPVIGEMPRLKGLFGAFGHSHYGLGMGPATARILAETILNEPSNDDRSPVSISRFL